MKALTRVNAAGARPRGVITINSDVPQGRLNCCDECDVERKGAGARNGAAEPNGNV